MAYMQDPLSMTGLAGPGATSITPPSSAGAGPAAKPQLTPANNTPGRGDAAGMQQMARQVAQNNPRPGQPQPGTSGQPIYQPGVNGPVVNAAIPAQTPVKASPTTPQPYQPSPQAGQFPPPPAKMAAVPVSELLKIATDLGLGSLGDPMDYPGKKPKWGRYRVDGAEALQDLEDRIINKKVSRKSGFKVPKTETKSAAGPEEMQGDVVSRALQSGLLDRKNSPIRPQQPRSPYEAGLSTGRALQSAPPPAPTAPKYIPGVPLAKYPQHGSTGRPAQAANPEAAAAFAPLPGQAPLFRGKGNYPGSAPAAAPPAAKPVAPPPVPSPAPAATEEAAGVDFSKANPALQAAMGGQSPDAFVGGMDVSKLQSAPPAAASAPASPPAAAAVAAGPLAPAPAPVPGRYQGMINEVQGKMPGLQQRAAEPGLSPYWQRLRAQTASNAQGNMARMQQLQSRPMTPGGNLAGMPKAPRPPVPKLAAAVPDISPFAAAFYLGCCERGFSADQIKAAIKTASAGSPDIAAELETFLDPASPVLEKHAAGIPLGGLAGKAWQAGKGFAGRIPGMLGMGAKAAPAAQGLINPAARGASGWQQAGRWVGKPLVGGLGGYYGGEAINAGLNATMGEDYEIPYLPEAMGVLGGGVSTPWGRKAINRLPATGGARTLANNAASFVSGGAAGRGPISSYVQGANRMKNLAGTGIFAANTVTGENWAHPRQAAGNMANNAATKMIDSKMQEHLGMTMDQAVNHPMTRVMKAYNTGGIPAAISAGWNELTPQQKTGLITMLAGGAAGLGAAAMGHPLLGAGLGLGGLGAGGYMMYQGGGNPTASQYQGANAQTQQQLQKLIGSNPEFMDQLQTLPRAQQHSAFQELMQQLQGQQAGSEVARASG